jgi:molybdopterin/thiamine biosynthesis adenylyltransferase
MDADLSKNAAFMDLYSRQIGTYGIETMAKLINMKVIIVGLKGTGVEIAKNVILAGPGSVILCDDEPTEIKDIGTNFFLTDADVGKPRASSCAGKLQELNGLVKVVVHSGELTEALVSASDVLVMTTTNRDELIRWNTFCRSNVATSVDPRGKVIAKSDPVRFIAVGALGALGYIFSDFGPEFMVADETGEPPVQRVITHISSEPEGIVTLLNPNDSELAKKADIADTDHQGFVTFSEVEGMYAKDEQGIRTMGHSINSSGPWRAREVITRVPDELTVPKNRGGDGIRKDNQYWVHVRDKKTGEYKTDSDRPDGLEWTAKFSHECRDVPEEDFVRDEQGNKMMRMADVKDHYKLKIGDTSGYSTYHGGGIIQQVYQPVAHRHKSLAESLQQPIPDGVAALSSCDGEKEALGWWYPMLHVLKQALFHFQSVEGRLPIPNDDAETEQVLAYCKQYNSTMRHMQQFCGQSSALSIPVDLNAEPCLPPNASDLKGNPDKQEAVEALKGMGASEESAMIALGESNWNVDDAMMVMFDEGRMKELTGGVTTYKCLAALRRLIRAAGAELQPMAVFMGGVCAQEVVKHCGKFTPINQWIHIDFVEVLPAQQLSPEETAPRGSRYDNNIALFGATVQQQLLDVRTFMVGCGALGCELLKNFAMMGVACGPNGLVTVTDGDRIEVSNLNRQFLFRKEHVKKAKSLTAANAVQAMNPDINVDALELLAMTETEKVFNDDFWIGSGKANRDSLDMPGLHVTSKGGLNFVVNALDNVKARKYVDSRCVFYGKALLESGTEGTKFNTMVVVPGETVSYDEGEADAPEGEAIPMCTLRNFPSTIIHCIEWARGLFEDMFVTPVADLQEFLHNPAEYIGTVREQAEMYMMDMNELHRAKDKLCDGEGNGLLRSMRMARAVRDGGYAACVRIARDIFIQLFNHSMRDLIHQFPKDALKNGKPFWAPPKRFPTVMDIDMNDEFVVSFLMSVANLVAVAYGLNPLPVNGIDANGKDYDTFVAADSHWRSMSSLVNALPTEPLVWTPSSKKIEADENEEEDAGPAAPDASMQDMVAELVAMLDDLGSISTDGLQAQPADFEKDLDQNFHIDFISASSNLRASNYGIPRATRHKTKMIAGKIIAAIATSTACATALVGVELLKLVQKKSVDQHRDSTCNFAVNQFQLSEPSRATVYKGSGEKRQTPDPIRNPEMFDDAGNVDWSKVPVSKWQAYPDPHTKWDRLHLSSSLSLQDAIAHLKNEHGLKLQSWMVTVIDESGKHSGAQIYSEPPVDPTLDEEVLLQVAPLSLTDQKAKIAIMKSGDIKNKQSYTQRWFLLKAMESDDFHRKMQTSLRTHLEAYLGPLNSCGCVPLEMSLHIAADPTVEAVTPAIILDI